MSSAVADREFRVCTAASCEDIMAEKKGILAVSFGTSYERARKEAIDAVEEQWRSVFPDCELRRAFTSPRIIRKLAAQGLSVPDVAQALKGMEAEGFTHVWVQPTLLIPGEEYDRLCEAVKVLEHDFTLLKIGEPLLCQEEDYDNAVRIMMEKYPVREGEACVLMGHGTPHDAGHIYRTIGKKLEAQSAGRYSLATVEGEPAIEEAADKLPRDVRKVTLVPFMLVAGDHAMNDMAGSGSSSFRSVLEARGYEVECVIRGMGAYPEIRALYDDKLRKLRSDDAEKALEET